mmetsp:Transcript_41530/g.134081  ORF Transcript_41530/g.134081 Transcript_41530/m.134081 type:complete len:458 (-) Transcript_41530:68-1441(-)|eukprot:CAMPEP_0203890980 /NCGR_PEP_ID=MMETSP0359-20131031/34336_1 /ASSEMBLY_ACC=CAM_ASM_000338 /TAXON_ID=268821 /ORGANISM="Scrippsiella Hangoei, Strain SHTV-5" /LENGTH=457 /DNA_ID=CAMNT_0050812699 /DNA_START=25 /DNA_END=1398 /DNA_ORIENTATION=+
MASIGKCRLLTACYAGDVEAAAEACEVVRSAVPKVCDPQARDRRSGPNGAGTLLPRGPSAPMMFPPPFSQGRNSGLVARLPYPDVMAGGLPGGPSPFQAQAPPPRNRRAPPGDSCVEPGDDDEGVPGGHGAGGCSVRSTTTTTPDTEDLFDPLQTAPSTPSASSSRSWRQSCEERRGRASVERALVQQVVDWGPQVGHVVDLRTGEHRTVTFWLREDVRALCVFDRTRDMQVRLFLSSHMDKVVETEQATEVFARQFFLNLDQDGLRRGLLITMSKSHAVQVVHQGHIGAIRAQLLLLCKDRQHRKAMVGALRALMSELMVHELPPESARNFVPLSERSRLPSSDSFSDLVFGGFAAPPRTAPAFAVVSPRKGNQAGGEGRGTGGGGDGGGATEGECSAEGAVSAATLPPGESALEGAISATAVPPGIGAGAGAARAEGEAVGEVAGDGNAVFETSL